MAKRDSVLLEIIKMMKAYRAYWLAPVIIVMVFLLGLAFLSSLGGGAAAPFIYTLF